MRLKQLELSGFKSFAKTTILEFPASISAIVGPNGSGKSNLAEAIRWVLGEQSMKSLRGKRGEDLIWNGSPHVPRMGKGAVTLTFDNRDGRLPQTGSSRAWQEAQASLLDFQEISLSRKIFRDGMNEYYMNDSQVRLKDVVEFLARIGLGHTKHNIIGQGEVDRVLMASPRERRQIIEEALGLRVYQLKKEEAERKLDASRENLDKVESLIREITPHLKFLKTQAAKAEARDSIRVELSQYQKAYFAKEFSVLEKELQGHEVALAPHEKKLAALENEIGVVRKKIEEAEIALSRFEEARGVEENIAELEKRHRALSHEAGRIEGRLEAERTRPKETARTVDLGYVKDRIGIFIEMVRDFLGETEVATLKERLRVLEKNMKALLFDVEKGKILHDEDEVRNPMIDELVKKKEALGDDIETVLKEIEKLRASLREQESGYRAAQQEIRARDRALREKEEERGGVREALQRLSFEREQAFRRKEELTREFEESGLSKKDIDAEIQPDVKALAESGDDLRRKVEKFRIKLEEVGGIDDAVIKEYRDTEARHEFLTKETEDIARAVSGLKELIATLNKEIEVSFKEGFAKIRDEFHNYFRIIFGGGAAKLKLATHERRIAVPEEDEFIDEAAEEAGEATEEGIEIEVDLPKKRIKSLSMLSGGERALTSIALLFAITAVNPPPFLVLDETDAALDEANSKRYAAILRELSKKTQLIIVTHNRETMKQSGILYGVTMGDDGISKLLSLKLEEAEVYTNR
ncbi:MAG: AAA family ATPase [bacterium]|nr:AAA family ATPase [bacterium]